MRPAPMRLVRLSTLLSTLALAGALAFPALATAHGRDWDSYDRRDRYGDERWESPRHFERHHRHDHRHDHHRDIYDYDYRPRVIYRDRWPGYYPYYPRRGVTIIYGD